jgi:SAM-dependent methyltransferase
LLLKKAVAHGEASPRCLAYLTDRVCVNLDQPQIYGTQFHVVDDRLMPFPIADPAHLEERRANVKLEPFAENEQPVRQMADARPAPTQAHEGSAVTSVEGGWEDSAGAWIASLGAEGDFTRRYVTDPAVLERIQGRGFRYGLDVGCGEGRFCRILRQLGVATVGVDPTPSLISEAVRRDPTGDYRLGRAEALDFAHGSFDLVVSYLALIDIPDIQAAIAEMTRVLAPGGTLMIVNLASFSTAGGETGWVKDAQGQPLYFAIDRYLEERAIPAEWDGINIINWHRPLSTYMSLLLEQELRLIHFAEPRPRGCDDAHEVAEYERAPWAYVMEWRNDRKPRRAKRAVDPTSS